jgi:hypothetical protein
MVLGMVVILFGFTEWTNLGRAWLGRSDTGSNFSSRKIAPEHVAQSAQWFCDNDMRGNKDLKRKQRI